MINARAQNAYGVAHFAQQNHVPQVRWENVDIIGDFIIISLYSPRPNDILSFVKSFNT